MTDKRKKKQSFPEAIPSDEFAVVPIGFAIMMVVLLIYAVIKILSG